MLAKITDDTRLEEMTGALPPFIAAGFSFVLTGKAGTI
jgi:hypothetical protein